MDKDFSERLRNLGYYNDLNTKLEYEVGNYLRNKTQNPKNYSNDIRHQYASAMYARNKGADLTRMLGKLHEIINVSELESENNRDKAIDLYNNDVGIRYGTKYPDIDRKKLLDILFNDYYTNLENRKRTLGY